MPSSPIPGIAFVAELGQGTCGAVWLADHQASGRQVAVRLLPLSTRHVEVGRFLHEVPTLTGLRHPHLVPCLSGGLTAANTAYLVWDYTAGPTLAAHIERHGRLPAPAALALVRDLAGALEAALEAGLHHGAVRADNVILGLDGDLAQARLADLGTPHARQDDGIDAENRAPEEFDDPESVDYRADVYGLGCVLYHALVGHPPFTGRTLKGMVRAKITGEIPQAVQAKADVPLAVNTLITELMDPRQDHRPQNYREIRERCERLLGRDHRPLGRHGNRAAWIGVIAMVVVLGGLAWLLRPGDPPPAPAAPTTPRLGENLDDAAIWDVAHPLLLADPSLRLAAWLSEPGAAWDSDPRRTDGVLGRAGRLHRPLERLPVRLVATVRMADGTGRLLLGVVLADGRTAGVEIANIGAIVHAAVDPPVSGEPVSLPAGRSVTVAIELRADALIATVAGNRFDPLPLAAAPKDLFIEAGGDEPVSLYALGLQARR